MNQQGLQFPTIRDMNSYMVNMPNTVETIKWTLYDILAYGAGGFTSATFFQRAVGSGGITKASTNMVTPGSIPRGQQFAITGIEVQLYSDAADITAAAVAPLQIEEYYEVMTAPAYLELTIGSKPYVIEAPLIKFAPHQRVQIDVATATTTAATNISTGLAQVVGESFDLVPLLLIPNQNFDVRIVFDTAVAITTAARLGVHLNGYLTRNAQ
jgi:hypothetical protein